MFFTTEKLWDGISGFPEILETLCADAFEMTFRERFRQLQYPKIWSHWIAAHARSEERKRHDTQVPFLTSVSKEPRHEKTCLRPGKTNRPAQLQKLARDLKFRILKLEVL